MFIGNTSDTCLFVVTQTYIILVFPFQFLFCVISIVNLYCPKCGKEIPDGSTVCPECNATIEIASAQTTTTTEKKPAPVGFILGLVSIIAWFIPLFGYPVTICGIVFSAKQLKSTDSSAKTMAIVGLVLSIIFLVVTLINSVLGVLIQLSNL